MLVPQDLNREVRNITPYNELVRGDAVIRAIDQSVLETLVAQWVREGLPVTENQDFFSTLLWYFAEVGKIDIVPVKVRNRLNFELSALVRVWEYDSEEQISRKLFIKFESRQKAPGSAEQTEALRFLPSLKVSLTSTFRVDGTEDILNLAFSEDGKVVAEHWPRHRNPMEFYQVDVENTLSLLFSFLKSNIGKEWVYRSFEQFVTDLPTSLGFIERQLRFSNGDPVGKFLQLGLATYAVWLPSHWLETHYQRKDGEFLSIELPILELAGVDRLLAAPADVSSIPLECETSARAAIVNCISEADTIEKEVLDSAVSLVLSVLKCPDYASTSVARARCGEKPGWQFRTGSCQSKSYRNVMLAVAEEVPDQVVDLTRFVATLSEQNASSCGLGAWQIWRDFKRGALKENLSRFIKFATWKITVREELTNEQAERFYLLVWDLLSWADGHKA